MTLGATCLTAQTGKMNTDELEILSSRTTGEPKDWLRSKLISLTRVLYTPKKQWLILQTIRFTAEAGLMRTDEMETLNVWETGKTDNI